MRLYFPQWHSQSFTGPKMRSQNRPSRSGLNERELKVSGLVTSPPDHHVRWPWSSSRSRSFESRGPRISSGDAIRIWMSSKVELLGSRALRKSIMTAPFPALLNVLGGAQGHLEPQGLEFLHQHVEGLGDAGFRQVLSFHDGLVHAAAAVHVVRLDGEHLLERVRR